MRTPLASSPSLLLASASPRRRDLLGELGVPFKVVTADVIENETPSLDARQMVAYNAALKADWVAQRYPDAVVLGADTTVALDGEALNKPRDHAAAKEMLRRLSGRTHRVVTGVAVRHEVRGLRCEGDAVTEVTFKAYDDSVIEEYLQRVHVYDKAGGYGIQDHGDLLVERFQGELSTVIGLPLSLTKQFLTEAGLLP